jgi:2Fe-2S ferredoxin
MSPGEAIYHIQPLGRTITARPGESLMQAAARAGLRWPTICGGIARCGVCHVSILSAAVALPATTEAERRGLRLAPSRPQGPEVRLACQLIATGEITVEKTGVAPS